MKKTLLLVAAAVALVACSNEDTLVQQAPEAIGFDNAFVENSTRSVIDPSFDADNMFSDFAVFGFVEGATLFDGTRVAKAGDAGITDFTDQEKTGWKYNGTVYWIAGANYNFNAVAPLTDGGWTKTAANPTSTTLSFTNNGTTDLLYAYATAQGKVSGNAAVAFTFRHTLSKVKFSFENGYNASTATIKVYDVKIENAYQTATATLGETSTAWANHAGTLALEFGNASDAEATADVKENAEVAYDYGKTYESLNERFLIPGTAPSVTYKDKNNADVTVNAYKVTFKVDLLVNSTLVKTYNHTAYAKFAPEAGNAYDIKTVINADNIDPANKQEAIEFTVTTINDWDTDYNDDDAGDNNVTM